MKYEKPEISQEVQLEGSMGAAVQQPVRGSLIFDFQL